MEQEDLKLKIKMPMIPLRDVVIFPNTVSTLFVGREKSIFSLEDALRSNKKNLFNCTKFTSIGRANKRRSSKDRNIINFTADD